MTSSAIETTCPNCQCSVVARLSVVKKIGTPDPATVPAVQTVESQPHAPQRPVCPACGEKGELFEHFVTKEGKNHGRPFRAYKCPMNPPGFEDDPHACSQGGEFISGTFRFLDTRRNGDAS